MESYFPLESLTLTERRIAKSVLAMVFVLAIVLLTSLALLELFFPERPVERPVDITADWILYIDLAIIVIFAPYFVHKKRVYIAGAIAILGFYIIVTLAIILWGGISGPAPAVYFLILIIAGAIAGDRWITTGVSILIGVTYAAIAYLEAVGIITPVVQGFQIYPLTFYVVLIGGSGTLIVYASMFDDHIKKLEWFRNLFLAKVTHEMNTPLNNILPLAEMLLDEGEYKKINPDLTLIRDGALILSTIVEDLLLLEGLRFDKISLEKEQVSLSYVLKDVQAYANMFLNFSEQSKDIECSMHIEDDLPPLMLDVKRMRMVLYNLVKNAIKYTDTGTINIRAYRSNNHVCIDVADTGIGIPQSQMKHIFHELRQGNNHNSGLGLGLPIVKELIDLMGFDLDLKSEVGVGTTFTIILENA